MGIKLGFKFIVFLSHSVMYKDIIYIYMWDFFTSVVFQSLYNTEL